MVYQRLRKLVYWIKGKRYKKIGTYFMEILNIFFVDTHIQEFRKREKDDLYNLSKFCHNASLVVQPKKGRALMWYNHHLDNNNWLGKNKFFQAHIYKYGTAIWILCL